MHTELLDYIPLSLLFGLMMVLFGVAVEGGYRLGMWRRKNLADEKEQPVGAMVASILGLVALVLGFTFSLAASRFDARRMAVLDEANAIGTTYLRTSFLPEPERGEVRQLLREYVDVRIKGTTGGDASESIVKSEALQNEIWKRATKVAAAEPTPISGLFIQTLNDMIDMHSKRVLVGIRSRIPLVIWLGVYGLAAMGMLSVGYQSGLSGTRRSPMMAILVATFSLVLLLIADLDRGQEGLLRIGQQSMVDLQRSMDSPSP
jgi:hypothetical protein